MKKTMIITAMLIGNIAVSYSNVGEPVKRTLVDSSKSRIEFNVERTHSQLVNVWVKGVEEEFTSVALIDQRGKTIYYEYVKSTSDNFAINLKNLLPGKYYVKLNMDSEIRMKTLIIE